MVWETKLELMKVNIDLTANCFLQLPAATNGGWRGGMSARLLALPFFAGAGGDSKATPAIGFSIDELMNNAKAVRDITGISLETFEEISNRICAIKNTMPLDLKKRYCSQTKLDDNKKLYLTLYWLRHYPKNRVLHWQFKIARSTLTKYLRRTLALLFLSIRNVIRWPSDREIEDELYHWNIFLTVGKI